MWISIIIFSLLSTSLAIGSSCDLSTPLGTENVEMAQSFNKLCSPIDLNNKRSSNIDYDLSEFLGSDQDICKCLNGAKFNEILVPNQRKERFNQWEYDQAIREKLKHSLNDLVGNFTKFNNLLLTKEHPGNLLELDCGREIVIVVS